MDFSYTLVEVDEISNLPSGTQIAVKGSFKNLHRSLAFFYPLFSPDGYYYHHSVYLGNCQVAHFSGENKADVKPRYCDILQFMKAAKILKSLGVHLLDLPIRVVEVCNCNCRPGDRVPRLPGLCRSP